MNLEPRKTPPECTVVELPDGGGVLVDSGGAEEPPARERFAKLRALRRKLLTEGKLAEVTLTPVL